MNNFSFCKFRIPEGKRVIWEITNECNYGCKYCIFASTGRKPEGELETHQIFSLLQELKNQGFTDIKYTGGEPFIRLDMLKILKYTQEIGLNFDISTNASKIDENLALELSRLNFQMIHISLDGHNKETHEAVRGKKSFEPTIRGLKLLVKNNLKIRVGCVIHMHNENHIIEMIRFCEELGVSEVIFSMMEPVGRLRGKDTDISQRNIQDIISNIESNSSKIKVSHNLYSIAPVSFSSNQSCPGGDKFLFINSLGDISPCTWVSEKRSDLVQYNIKNNSLKNILYSMQRFKNMTLNMTGVCPMENLEEFHRQEKLNQKFSKIYAFTTENLEYMRVLNFQEKVVVTVGGSYDQAIVAYMLGASKVINIDTHLYSKYYAELKHNALKQFNYQQFKDFFLRNKESFSHKQYCILRKNLSVDCRDFFDDAFQRFDNVRESDLFNNLFDNSQSKIFNSLYLRNSNQYYLAQKNLKDFIWHTQSIQTNIISSDIVLFSNLSDYAHIMFKDSTEFREKISIPWFKKLNPNGKIMTGYIYSGEQRNKINNPEVRRQDYLGQYYEINIPTALTGIIGQDSACIWEKIDE